MGEAVFLIGAALAAALLWRMRPRRGAASGLEPDADLQVALHLAEHEARARRHAKVEPLHLLYALLQNEEISAALLREGVDTEAIDAHFYSALERLDDAEVATSRRQRERGPRWSAEAQQLLIEAVAEARASQREGVSMTQLASRLSRLYPELIGELEPTGLSRATLLAAMAHGADEQEPPPQLTDGQSADVLLHNDDFTPMELVVTVLSEVFDYERQAAIDKMMSVHHGPPAAVGRYPGQEAQRRLGEAVDRARAAGFPLRFTLRATAVADGDAS